MKKLLSCAASIFFFICGSSFSPDYPLSKKNAQVKTDVEEDNRSFFLSQYFYTRYNTARNNVSGEDSVLVTRIEVWITDRIHAANARMVVALMDLGESSPYNTSIGSGQNGQPSNQANTLYKKLTNDSLWRLDGNVNSAITAVPLSLQQGQDFEKSYSRKLSTSEYTLNQKLGYVSINSKVNPNDIVAIAFQYQYMGVVYQVGEFEDQVQGVTNTPNVIFLKLLKGNTPNEKLPLAKLRISTVSLENK